jgi:hypothetical protein
MSARKTTIGTLLVLSGMFGATYSGIRGCGSFSDVGDVTQKQIMGGDKSPELEAQQHENYKRLAGWAGLVLFSVGVGYVGDKIRGKGTYQ